MYAVFEDKQLHSDIKFTLKEALLKVAAIIVSNPVVDRVEVKRLVSYRSASGITRGQNVSASRSTWFRTQ